MRSVTDPLLPRPLAPPRTSTTALAAFLGVPAPAAETVVTGVSLSSQRIRPGDLYAALPGARAHGIDFADQAVAAGGGRGADRPVGRGPRAGRRTAAGRGAAARRAGTAERRGLRQPPPNNCG